jgi:hypothetical protein
VYIKSPLTFKTCATTSTQYKGENYPKYFISPFQISLKNSNSLPENSQRQLHCFSVQLDSDHLIRKSAGSCEHWNEPSGSLKGGEYAKVQSLIQFIAGVQQLGRVTDYSHTCNTWSVTSTFPIYIHGVVHRHRDSITDLCLNGT